MKEYTIEVRAVSERHALYIRRTFAGEKKAAYEAAMAYAYGKAEKFRDAWVDFTVTIHGEGWRTASKVNPLFANEIAPTFLNGVGNNSEKQV